MRPRTLLQGSGAAAFLLFRLYGSAIAHPTELRMHSPVPLTNFALSILVNLALTALVFACLGSWMGRSEKYGWLRLFLAGLVLSRLIKVIGATLDIEVRTPVEVAIFLAATIAAVVFYKKWRRGEEALLRATGAVLVGMGIFSIVVMLQLAVIAVWRPGPDFVNNLPAAAPASANRPRVVWIIFDELSYQQTFGDRYPNLRLPNFDTLRESSTLFTHTQFIANDTELAIPSILLGYPVARVGYTFRNQFQVATSPKGAFHPFNAALTPFARANQQGLTTGVIGWYNPYCSMLAPYLNLCYWNSEDDILLQQLGVRDGFWKDLANPWMHYFADGFRPRRKKILAKPRVAAFKDLIEQSDRALKRPDLDLLLLHLPLPHAPGFYNRDTGRFDETGNRSHVDNLALTDKTLGEIMIALQESPRWKNTSVIVCGDHSWRTWLWSPTPSWTMEDRAASHGGKFDSRPMLMIHLAGQTSPQTVTRPFPLLSVHSVLDDLVEGKQAPLAVSNH